MSGLVYGGRDRKAVLVQHLLSVPSCKSDELMARRTFMNVHSFCADKRDMNIQLPDLRLPR
jgi:hypothetical protein